VLTRWPGSVTSLTTQADRDPLAGEELIPADPAGIVTASCIGVHHAALFSNRSLSSPSRPDGACSGSTTISISSIIPSMLQCPLRLGVEAVSHVRERILDVSSWSPSAHINMQELVAVDG